MTIDHFQDLLNLTMTSTLKCQKSRRTRLAIDFSTGCACVWRARRVRNDDFTSTLVQGLNAGEKSSFSLVQRALSAGFLASLAKHEHPAEVTLQRHSKAAAMGTICHAKPLKGSCAFGKENSSDGKPSTEVHAAW